VLALWQATASLQQAVLFIIADVIGIRTTRLAVDIRSSSHCISAAVKTLSHFFSTSEL